MEFVSVWCCLLAKWWLYTNYKNIKRCLHLSCGKWSLMISKFEKWSSVCQALPHTQLCGSLCICCVPEQSDSPLLEQRYWDLRLAEGLAWLRQHLQ